MPTSDGNTLIELYTEGPPGPPGPQGPAGASGSRYEHTQSSAASTWTITHGLNRRPPVVILVGGEHVYADISYPSLTQVSIQFPEPTTGIAEM